MTLGLALRGTTDNPYARTRAATNGPDLVATVFPGGAPGPAQASELLPLDQAGGVVAHSGPFPVTWTLLRNGPTTRDAEIEGRSPASSAVDQPKLIQGTWVRPGGVVVEAAFARAFGLHVGDRLTLGGRSFGVVGTAVTAAVPSFSLVCYFVCLGTNQHEPGLVWATEADARGVAGTTDPVAYFLDLKLRNPARASAFASHYDAGAAPAAPHLYSWNDIKVADAKVIANVQMILFTGSWLLGLMALASVAVLVSGRMVEQTRRVGLLKAIGATPRLVAVVLGFEHALIGLCAGGLGLFVGWLTAPLIDGPGAGLLGAPSAPSMSNARIALVVGVALAVAIVVTFVSAIRATHQSTVAALEDSARPPRRRTAVIRFSAHLPAPLLLGVRLAVRRPRRLLLSAFSVAVSASGLVAVLVLHATAASWSFAPGLAQATTIVSVMLVVLAAVNAVFIAWATVLDVRHAAALARALGAAPEQIISGLTVAQSLPTLLGALLGIPGGIAIYDATKNGGPTTTPPALWLVAMVVVTLLVITVLTAIPARIGTRRPVAELLQAEAAA